ncbi:Rhs-family protein [Minicystis rosea]|nr:Rhs-family protein [Minicystis rosea]
MAGKHIADAESKFVIVNVTPDFCAVGGAVVPFDISQVLPREKAGYAKAVFARGKKVLMIDSVINGVCGNAGSGVRSGVSLGAGDNKIIQGASSVRVEGRRVARHLDEVLMNGVF